MASFIENVRATNQSFPYLLSTLQGRREQNEYAKPGGEIMHANVPSVDEGANSPDWRNRVVIPFSVTKNGEKIFGMVHVPESVAAVDFRPEKGNKPILVDTEIYGGETMDGGSFTAKGFNKFIQESDKGSFKIESELVNNAKRAKARKANKGGAYTGDVTYGIYGVNASDTDGMKDLREQLRYAQAYSTNTLKNNSFIDSLRLSMGGK